MDALDALVDEDLRLRLLLIAALHQEAERLTQQAGPGSGEGSRG